MKKEAIRVVIKDFVIILLMQIIAIPFTAYEGAGYRFLWLAITGIPFGWRWASKLITAVSMKGLGQKIVISALLGCVAIFVVVIKDIIQVFKAPEDVVENPESNSIE